MASSLSGVKSTPAGESCISVARCQSTGPISTLTAARQRKAGLKLNVRQGQLRNSRAFYCFMVGRRVTVLHAFIKKTQQTPDHELKLARKRLKELQNG
jgi:phage-related protein